MVGGFHLMVSLVWVCLHYILLRKKIYISKFFLLSLLGFCSDSFEPGTGMIKCRTFLPTKIDTNNSSIKDIQCGKTFSAFITNKNEVKYFIFIF